MGGIVIYSDGCEMRKFKYLQAKNALSTPKFTLYTAEIAFHYFADPG
jgi:hypothetical protein